MGTPAWRKVGPQQAQPYLVPWGAQQDEAVFPLEEGPKVLALLIAAQLHCLHTLLLVLGRDMKYESWTPAPQTPRPHPRPWSYSVRASLDPRLPINHQDQVLRPQQPVMAGGTPSRDTLKTQVHVRCGAHSPEVGSRPDSNVPKAIGGNWRGLEKGAWDPCRPRDQAEMCGNGSWKREQVVTKQGKKKKRLSRQSRRGKCEQALGPAFTVATLS